MRKLALLLLLSPGLARRLRLLLLPLPLPLRLHSSPRPHRPHRPLRPLLRLRPHRPLHLRELMIAARVWRLVTLALIAVRAPRRGRTAGGRKKL